MADKSRQFVCATEKSRKPIINTLDTNNLPNISSSDHFFPDNDNISTSCSDSEGNMSNVSTVTHSASSSNVPYCTRTGGVV